MDREELNSKLLEAAEKGDTDKIWELIEQGADIDTRNKWGDTALMLLAYNGSLTPELLEALVSRGADVNASDEWGNTALIWSALWGHLTPELLEAFISHGADINAQDDWNRTALMESARNGHLTPELLDAFIEHRTDINARDDDDNTALIWSARRGHLTPKLARAFANEFIRLGMSLEEIHNQTADINSAAVLVYVLLKKLETEPGLVVDFMKKHVGEEIEKWVKDGVEGADVLVSRLAYRMRHEELMSEGAGMPDLDLC